MKIYFLDLSDEFTGAVTLEIKVSTGNLKSHLSS